MFKVFVILLICGIISAQNSPGSTMMRRRLGNNRARPFGRLGTLAQLAMGSRLSKRNLPQTLAGSGIGTNGAAEKLRSKFRKSFVGKRKNKRPSRGLKYYFNLATPNGGCGCGGTGDGKGNVNCKCINKPNEQQSAGKS